MPVPSLITELTTTAATNSPDGDTESVITADNYFRAHAAFIAQLRDGKQAALGFTPVQQNGGIGQGSVTVKLGQSGVTGDSRLDVGGSDRGRVVTELGNSMAPWSITAADATTATTLNTFVRNGLTPVGNIIDMRATGGAGVDVRLQTTATSNTNLTGTFQILAASTNTYDATGYTCSGNITANSDERLKTNWTSLDADFLDNLAKIKHGNYTRIDSGMSQTGVSAQELQRVLPNAVVTGGDKNKTLSVAYGNAALVACIQLARRVVSLEARLSKLEAA
jgi:hypothetical protein